MLDFVLKSPWIRFAHVPILRDTISGSGVYCVSITEGWLLLSRWVNLTADQRQELNQLFTLNKKVFKAYLLKESLDRLWTYHYRGSDAELPSAVDQTASMAAA